MTTHSVDLFTNEEHAIIANWLQVEPKCDAPNLSSSLEILEALGFSGKARGYNENDAAVAAVLLERIQGILPQGTSLRFIKGKGRMVVETPSREESGCRTKRIVEMLPKYLLTINWARRGPIKLSPVKYHVTWVPIYNEYVVTQSADSTRPYGYCDFAIGHFPQTKDFIHDAARTIKKNWEWKRDQFNQHRWAFVSNTGLIKAVTARHLAREVWGDE